MGLVVLLRKRCLKELKLIACVDIKKFENAIIRENHNKLVHKLFSLFDFSNINHRM